MRKRFQMGTGPWWRYSAYEIRAGVIQPRKGAVLEEFDLKELRSKDARGRRQAPYQTLINLVRRGAQCNGNKWRFNPSRKWREELLAWCSSFGLLGMLPQITHSVILAPHWSAFVDVDRSGRRKGATVLVPQAYRFNRANLGWIKKTYPGMLDRPTVQRPFSKQLIGQPVSKRLWPPGWPRPSAFLHPIDVDGELDELREEPLGRTWGTFFPSVPEDKREVYPYPMPGTDEFWEIYAEPVKLFWKLGMQLAWIDENLRKYKEKIADKQFRVDLTLALVKFIDVTDREDEGDDNIEEGEVHNLLANVEKYGDAIDILWSVTRLNYLLQAVQPAVLFNDDRVEQKWFAGSLLSAFAMMMLQDLVSAVIIRECPVDGVVFSVEAEHWTKYCSPACAERGRKREQRAKKKESAIRRIAPGAHR